MEIKNIGFIGTGIMGAAMAGHLMEAGFQSYWESHLRPVFLKAGVKDERRMHKTPIPRLGGLAIFIGFMVSILLFVPITPETRSILLGAVVIVVLGVLDDSMDLPALLKFVVQIGAALIPVLSGVRIQVFSNPNIFSDNLYWHLGRLSIPLTVLWIVAITNSVNLIDGLDGLADGISTISATTMLVIALLGEEADVAIVLGALVGACLGFLPYNLHPARMFMGDTGATFLGFILATMSVQGLFKYYAVISFVVPFLILGLPIFDTAFAFTRRLAHGQSPMRADRGHIHHRLIDMGLSQKQAVATLYVISAILGLSAVVLTTGGEQRAILLFAALCIASGGENREARRTRRLRTARQRAMKRQKRKPERRPPNQPERRLFPGTKRDSAVSEDCQNQRGGRTHGAGETAVDCLRAVRPDGRHSGADRPPCPAPDCLYRASGDGGPGVHQRPGGGIDPCDHHAGHGPGGSGHAVPSGQLFPRRHRHPILGGGQRRVYGGSDGVRSLDPGGLPAGRRTHPAHPDGRRGYLYLV